MSENWKQYNDIKYLIDAYWILKDEKKYDEFIKKLVGVLEL